LFCLLKEQLLHMVSETWKTKMPSSVHPLGHYPGLLRALSCDCCLSLLPSGKASDSCALVSSTPTPHLVRCLLTCVKSCSPSRQCPEIVKKDYGFIGLDYNVHTAQTLCTLFPPCSFAALRSVPVLISFADEHF